MAKARFTTELVEGHQGVTVAIVPFDPVEVWGADPIELDGGRPCWLVRGTINKARFDGWIGQRWGRHFLIVDEALRRAAKAEVGAPIDVVVEPTTRAQARAVADAQAPLTTKPGKRKRRT